MRFVGHHGINLLERVQPGAGAERMLGLPVGGQRTAAKDQTAD